MTMKEISISKRNCISTLLEEGYSSCTIAFHEKARLPQNTYHPPQKKNSMEFRLDICLTAIIAQKKLTSDEDEAKFKIFNSDGREWCWKDLNSPLLPQHVKLTVKYCGG
ncbi:2174_t:CDS:2, partial [Dentiscutata heterogama]